MFCTVLTEAPTNAMTSMLLSWWVSPSLRVKKIPAGVRQRRTAAPLVASSATETLAVPTKSTQPASGTQVNPASRLPLAGTENTFKYVSAELELASARNEAESAAAATDEYPAALRGVGLTRPVSNRTPPSPCTSTIWLTVASSPVGATFAP